MFYAEVRRLQHQVKQLQATVGVVAMGVQAGAAQGADASLGARCCGGFWTHTATSIDPFQLATGSEKKHTLRYIAGPPAALRGTQPSQAIMLVKPSASGAKAAPAPVMQTNCRASVFSARQRGYGVLRGVLLHRSWA